MLYNGNNSVGRTKQIRYTKEAYLERLGVK
jgi:hypothetical protein